MSELGPVDEFKKGLGALLSGQARSALPHLQKAYEHNAGNPFYVSYYGLALARTEADCARATGLCQAALRMKSDHPDIYVNLAEVYRRAGAPEDALWTLYSGLHFTRWDSRLVRALEIMGVRRRPILTFLDRKNFLNRQLGRLRHRLWGKGNLTALWNPPPAIGSRRSV